VGGAGRGLVRQAGGVRSRRLLMLGLWIAVVAWVWDGPCRLCALNHRYLRAWKLLLDDHPL
jgi:hypothetical protein